MPVIKTPRALIEVLGAPDEEGRYPITGYEIESHYTFEGEGSQLFTPKIQRDEATIDKVNALRDKSETALTAQLTELNSRFSALREERDSLQAQRDLLQSRLQRIVEALA